MLVQVVLPHAAVGALDLRLEGPRQPLARAQGTEHKEAHHSRPVNGVGFRLVSNLQDYRFVGQVSSDSFSPENEYEAAGQVEGDDPALPPRRRYHESGLRVEHRHQDLQFR